MRLFGRASRTRVLTRVYGRDAFLIWLSPVLASINALLGLRVGLRSDASVRAAMERDALALAEQGYRVVSSYEHDLPLLFAPGWKTSYYTVTYELTDTDGDTHPRPAS